MSGSQKPAWSARTPLTIGLLALAILIGGFGAHTHEMLASLLQRLDVAGIADHINAGRCRSARNNHAIT